MEKKLKVLIGCLSFSDRTGSEMYVYELSKNLVNLNCDVTVVSPNTNGPLPQLARSMGVKVNTFQSLPVHSKFDIIHTQHQPITHELIKRFPTTKKIATIHSEVLEAEYPIIHPTIKKYIAIRPKIKDMLVERFQISEEKISLIYNPIDNEKFTPLNNDGVKSVLFVGSLEYLRRNPLFDMLKYTRENNMELWIVGKNHSNYLSDLVSYSHVKYFNPTPDVEQYIHNCTETAGIMLGRTTIEGWMCGKPGWIYEVDAVGNILNKEKHEPPNDIEKFHAMNVTKQIKEEYLKIIG